LFHGYVPDSAKIVDMCACPPSQHPGWPCATVQPEPLTYAVDLKHNYWCCPLPRWCFTDIGDNLCGQCFLPPKCCLYRKENSAEDIAICVQQSTCPSISFWVLTSQENVGCDDCYIRSPSPSPSPITILYCCIYREDATGNLKEICAENTCKDLVGFTKVGSFVVDNCDECG